MAIGRVTIEVSCDECGTEVELEFEMDLAVSESQVFNRMEKLGWGNNGGDICPKCVLTTQEDGCPNDP